MTIGIGVKMKKTWNRVYKYVYDEEYLIKNTINMHEHTDNIWKSVVIRIN
jgi:hypothetical protein